ncbi:MAG: transposase [Betaproteobacteria bacterium]|nr:transposase [Betaproteobacteria bacterium]
MARLPRIDLPGCPQHLVVRGNNRSTMFRDDADRMIFLRFVEDHLEESAMDLHAYVLMSNHVHLLATAHREHGVSAFMHRTGSKFARLMNLRWGRTGTLFEGRFRSSLVQDDIYLVTCMRYIDLNPVRAGLARHPADYPWSSYRRNAGMEPLAPLVANPAYLALANSPVSRGQCYRALCEAGMPQGTLDTIRERLAASRPLGSAAFVEDVDSRLGLIGPPRARGRPRKK